MTSERLRRKMVESLVTMAAADGRIGSRERVLIERFCAKWGVEPSVLDESIEAAKSGKRRLHLPKTDEERTTLLEALVAVAAVDGVIDDGERKCLRAFGDRLGLSVAEQEALLDRGLTARNAARKARKARSAAKPEPVPEPEMELAPEPAFEPSAPVLHARPIPDAELQARIVLERIRPPEREAPPSHRNAIIAGVVAFGLCTLGPLVTGLLAGASWVSNEEALAAERSVPTAKSIAKAKKSIRGRTRRFAKKSAEVEVKIARVRERRRVAEGAPDRIAKLEGARARHSAELRRTRGR